MADQVKVILWTIPRCISSSFLKCMNGVPDSKMLFEMYSTARAFGPDNQMPSYDISPEAEVITDKTPEELKNDPGSGFHSSICTYEWLKHHMETGYPDKQLVFAKEMSFFVAGKFDFLPDSGYRHAFLIRNPAKVFPSWKKMMVEMSTIIKKKEVKTEEIEFDEMHPEIMPPGKGFKESYDLYSYVKEKGLDSDPVIIDADDLVSDPATILSGFCKTLGIPYSDELLSWDYGVEVVESWTISQPLKNLLIYTTSFKNFRSGTCFVKLNVKGHTSDPEMSADIQRLIDFSMPYYTKMFEKRMK